MAELTVIVPVFNMPDSVLEAVDSVLEQNIDVDILIVDDGSVPSLKLPQKYMDFQNISIIRHEKNRGASAARNTGISNTTSEWVTFLDADDTLKESTLRSRFQFCRELKNLHSSRPTLFGCGWVQKRASRRRWIERIPNGASQPAEFASGCWYSPGSCVLAQRAVFEEFPFDENVLRLEDFDFGIRFGMGGGQLIVDDTIGAIIEPSNRVNAATMNRSADQISFKHQHLRKEAPDVWRRLQAYLNLERATTSFRCGQYLKCVSYCLKSFFFKPRLSVHFSPKWKAET